MEEYLNRITAAREIVEKLLESKRYDFKGLKPFVLQDNLPVVYAIFDKADGTCLYVGRIKTSAGACIQTT